jgi:hypothetical protein
LPKEIFNVKQIWSFQLLFRFLMKKIQLRKL